ncbi:choice-of-anchor A family protein [Sandaracinobacter sp. RS1-74]|uniref:collagen-binding domain-containing protein n=1 Tax=Sandaracinobacteroides sayramensis TaxID=2913411 RepID=UPI001EDC22BE|nr:collagen-binding domain-containing protein [Sandaracinobacteroides sayramensis]MCG2839397.1 choice-of-anchor A family protein [Sandaracinobacteroides sayramensis]
MKLRTLAAFGFGGLILAAQPALAAAPVGDPLAGLQAMRETNAIILGNAQGWLTVEGKTFIGGNLSGGGQFGGGNGTQGAAASNRATLTVGGNTSGGIVSLSNGSNGGNGNVGAPASVVVGGDFGGANVNTSGATVKVGGSVSNINGSQGTTVEAGGAGKGYLNAGGGSIAVNKGDQFTTDLRAGIAAETGKLEADLKALSLSLAQVKQTSGNSIVENYGARTLNAVDNGTGVSVFTLSEADLNGWQFKLNVADPALTVVFNILGDGNYNWNTGLAGAFGPDFAGNVIWNFSDAASVHVSQGVFGSILAPFANVVTQSAVSGSIVANGLRAHSAVKLGTYDGGNLGFGAADAVPEPATWAMLIIGFGLVGMAMRRREGIARLSA